MFEKLSTTVQVSYNTNTNTIYRPFKKMAAFALNRGSYAFQLVSTHFQLPKSHDVIFSIFFVLSIRVSVLFMDQGLFPGLGLFRNFSQNKMISMPSNKSYIDSSLSPSATSPPPPPTLPSRRPSLFISFCQSNIIQTAQDQNMLNLKQLFYFQQICVIQNNTIRCRHFCPISGFSVYF